KVSLRQINGALQQDSSLLDEGRSPRFSGTVQRRHVSPRAVAERDHAGLSLPHVVKQTLYRLCHPRLGPRRYAEGQSRAPVRVHSLAACCENPEGTSCRPGRPSRRNPAPRIHLPAETRRAGSIEEVAFAPSLHWT